MKKPAHSIHYDNNSKRKKRKRGGGNHKKKRNVVDVAGNTKPLPSSSVTTLKTSSSYLDKMKARLSGSFFRMINEKLYTSTGYETLHYFEKDPSLFNVYHMTPGGCKFGEGCKFNHGSDNSSISQTPELNFLGLPIRLAGTIQTSERGLPTPPAFAMKNLLTQINLPLPHHLCMVVDEYPERPGEPECSFFLKTGECKYKSSCKFHHPKNRKAKAKSNSYSLSKKGLPLRPGQPICAHYHQYGICKYGPACKYDHPSNLTSPIKCLSPSSKRRFDTETARVDETLFV